MYLDTGRVATSCCCWFARLEQMPGVSLKSRLVSASPVAVVDGTPSLLLRLPSLLQPRFPFLLFVLLKPTREITSRLVANKALNLHDDRPEEQLHEQISLLQTHTHTRVAENAKGKQSPGRLSSADLLTCASAFVPQQLRLSCLRPLVASRVSRLETASDHHSCSHCVTRETGSLVF